MLKIDRFLYLSAKVRQVITFFVFYRWRLHHCGQGSYILSPKILINICRLSLGGGVRILHGSRIEIQSNAMVKFGHDISVGHNLFLTCYNQISIGSGCLISDNVAIIDNRHVWEVGVSPSQGKVTADAIKIGRNVTIYRNATILAGTTIEDGCVIAANAIVSGRCSANRLYAGQPAKSKRCLLEND